MPKILYHIPTGETKPYPRADDQPVDGLSDDYQVLEVVSDPMPTDFDEATHYAEATTGKDGDQWRTSYQVKPRPPVNPFPFGLLAITPRQLRLELLNRGLLANVEAAINSLPEPQKTGALIEWEYASQFLRAHPMVSAIAAAVGISSETLDDIFAAAAGL